MFTQRQKAVSQLQEERRVSCRPPPPAPLLTHISSAGCENSTTACRKLTDTRRGCQPAASQRTCTIEPNLRNFEPPDLRPLRLQLHPIPPQSGQCRSPPPPPLLPFPSVFYALSQPSTLASKAQTRLNLRQRWTLAWILTSLALEGTTQCQSHVAPANTTNAELLKL
jgi:hypothetical protein